MNGSGFRTICFFIVILCSVTAPLSAQPPTWIDVSGRTGFRLLSELYDGTLFGVYENILYRSFDGGTTWENFPRPAGPVLEFTASGDVAALVVFVGDVFNSRQLFVSTDRGDTWTRYYGERSFPISAIHQNIMVASWGEIYSLEYSSMRATVQRYRDGRWEQLGVPSSVLAGPYRAPFTVSAIDQAGAVYIGSETDGIHSTRDNGATWTKTLSYREISAIDVAPDGTVYIASEPNGRTNGGVYSSTDHGLTWEPMGLINTTITDLATDSSGNIFATSPSGISRYAGEESWISLGPFDFAYDILHVTSSSKYVATSPGLGMLISHDAGDHWAPDGVRRQDVYTVSGASDGSILAGTVGEGIFRSTDGGSIWQQYRGPGIPDYFYVLHRSGNRVFAGTESGLYRSDDHGVSWVFLTEQLNTPEASTPVYSIAIRPWGPLFIGTGSGVYRSTDDGLTWLESGLNTSRVQGLNIGPATTLYAATAESGIFTTVNDGATWSGLGLVRSDVQSMAVNEVGHIAVGVFGGVYRSTDGGASWDWRIFAQGHVYSLLYNGNHQLFAATSGGMFASDDGGGLWYAAGLDREFVVSLAYDRNHAILCGVYKTGVFTTTAVITSVETPGGLPVAARLFQNYPNPFNPQTTIAYHVSRVSDVTVVVYDLLGREIAPLYSGRRAPGSYTATWSAKGEPSGVYYYRVRIKPAGDDFRSGGPGPTTGSLDEVRKMVLLR